MSNVNVNREFAQFGKYCLILAILSILAFIFGIGAYFVSVLEYVNYAIQIGIIVIVILAVINIGKAGNALKNDDLLKFRNFIVIALILIFVGLIFIGIGINNGKGFNV